jgi:hypothetical protein
MADEEKAPAQSAEGNASEATPKSSGDSSEAETGAPWPGGVDPELTKLPRKSASLSPYLAGALVALCALLMFRLRADLTFSREAEPQKLSNFDEIAAADLNSFVEFEGVPDRAQALRITASESQNGVLLAPVFGARGKLWIVLPGSPFLEEVRYDEFYRGRLMSLADMPFAEVLDDYLRSDNLIERPFDTKTIEAALRAEATSLRDHAGDDVAISSTTPVKLFETSVENVEVTVSLTEDHPDEAGWTLALQNTGLLPAAGRPVSSTDTSWTYHVVAPSGSVEHVRRILLDAQLWSATATAIHRTREGTWKDLNLDGEDLLLGEPQSGFRPTGISVFAPPPLVEDARILVTTERPDELWYVLPLFLLLSGFALLFAFGYWRSRRA